MDRVSKIGLELIREDWVYVYPVDEEVEHFYEVLDPRVVYRFYNMSQAKKHIKFQLKSFVEHYKMITYVVHEFPSLRRHMW